MRLEGRLGQHVWEKVVGWGIVCTILQLWRERRTRSMGSIPRVWGGLEVVDYPLLKMLGLFSELLPIRTQLCISRLLKGTVLVTLDAEGRKRPEELSIWYMTHQFRMSELKCSHIMVAWIPSDCECQTFLDNESQRGYCRRSQSSC